MQTKFLILIILAFLITFGFGVLIMQQMTKVEKRALAAKQRKNEYEQELLKNMNNSTEG